MCWNKLLIATTTWCLCTLCVVHAETLELLEPAPNAIISLLTAKQQGYFNRSQSDRIALMTNKVARAEIGKIGTHPRKVKFAWRSSGEDLTTYQLEVRRASDRKVFQVKTTPNSQAELENLEIATEYIWRVVAKTSKGVFPSPERRFITHDSPPRFLHVNGVPSLRDLGGRVGLGGRRVRQGLIFRSGGLNSNAKRSWVTLNELEIVARQGETGLVHLISGTVDTNLITNDATHYANKILAYTRKGEPIPHHFSEQFLRLEQSKPGALRLDEQACHYMTNTLAIRTDIDLRTKSECIGMTESPLGPNVKWLLIPSSGYGGMKHDYGKQAFAKAFRVMLDRRNYPIIFHCIAGADRTGSLAFILNGLLGVSEDLLWKDWEINSFIDRNPDFKHEGRITALSTLFNSLPGKTLADKCEAYVLSCGFTANDISAFRRIMLEPMRSQQE